MTSLVIAANRLAIEVTNLAERYRGVPVLHDVSFSVERRTVFALLGANGSAKTTTVVSHRGGRRSVAGLAAHAARGRRVPPL